MALFKKPFRLSSCFVFGGILVVLGLVLQVLLGPVDWARAAFPVNIALLVIFLSLLYLAFSLRGRFSFCAWLGSPAAAVPSIAWAFLLTVVMGLTAQIPSRGWLGGMVTFHPFVLVYTWMSFVVGMVAFNHLGRIFRSWREVSATLNHLGLLTVLLASTLGSADKRTLEMTLREGQAETVAVREDGMPVETGLTVFLNDFTMETYPNGMPRRFASDVIVTTGSGKEVAAVIEVNKPLKVDGWKMYQYDYDSEAGPDSVTSVLQMVRAPWLPVVLAGIFMMLSGALLMLATGFERKEVAS